MYRRIGKVRCAHREVTGGHPDHFRAVNGIDFLRRP